VPMANEEATAVSFVDAVLSQCSSRGFASIAFLAVLDRACSDQTLNLLRQHAGKQPLLQVIWAPDNKGVVDAYVRGLPRGSREGARLDFGNRRRVQPSARGYPAILR